MPKICCEKFVKVAQKFCISKKIKNICEIFPLWIFLSPKNMCLQQWRIVHLVWQARIFFYLFSLYINITPSCFPLLCSTVCKPEVDGCRIAIRAKVEWSGKLIFLFDDWNIDHRRWLKRCFFVNGTQLFVLGQGILLLFCSL